MIEETHFFALVYVSEQNTINPSAKIVIRLVYKDVPEKILSMPEVCMFKLGLN